MTVSRHDVNVTKNFNVILSAIIANLCGTAVMSVMSWSSPALPMITQKGGAKIFVSLEQGALLSSIAALGACFGPFITGRLTDYIGRKSTLLLAMALVVFTWTVLYFCTNFAILLCTRFIAGICAGCVYGTLPMYISEISTVSLRGSLGAALQFFDCVGYLIEYIGGSFLNYEQLILLSGATALLSFLSFMLIPESPYYLYSKGKKREGFKSLHFLRGHVDKITLQKEIEEIEISTQIMKDNTGSLVTLFTDKKNVKPLYYAAALIFFQQASGINAVTFYCKTIFQKSGSSISTNMSSIVVALVMAFTSVITTTAAGFIPLRHMLSFSSIGISIGMFSLASYFYLMGEGYEMEFWNWVPVTSLIMFIFSYTIGFGPLPWIYTSLIFPAHLKAVACALSSSFMWFLSFIITSCFLSVDVMWVFLIFGMITLLSLFFILFQLPETKGKTYNEIQEMMQGVRNTDPDTNTTENNAGRF